MSLDLGALVGRAIIDDGPFQRTYSRLMRQMAELGRAGEKTAASTSTLDESLTATGKAATTASAGIDRTTRASTSAAAAEEKAAAAASRHAQAVTRVAAMMDETAALTPRVQAATLRLAAAQERLNELQASGTATTRQLASAQAGLIGAQRTLTAAQDAGTAATSRWRTGLMRAGRTALELGLLIGGIEIARKAIEFVAASKHLTDALNSVQAAAQATDAQMKPVRATVIALGKDLTVPGATALDAAHAIDDLVRSGMTLPRAMAAARSALLLVSVTNTNAALSARVLGDALDEFQLPASQAAHVATMLAAAATSTSGGLDTVFEALQYSGTRARSAQIPMADLLATIVDLSKAGLQGTTIGTGLAMAISKLANPSAAGARALDDLGIKAWDAQGKFKGLPYIVDQVFKAKQRFGANSEQFLKDITVVFGARAANAIAAFSGKGIEGLNRFEKRLSSFDLQKAANEMNRGVGAGFRQLSKEATAAGIAVYDKLEKPITSAVMWVGDKLPAAVSTAAHVLGPFGSFLGSTLGTAWDLFIDGAKIVAMVLGPVVHLIDSIRTPLGAIGAATLGAYLGFKLFSAIPAIMTAVWSSITRIPGVVSEMSASVQGSVSTYMRSMALIGGSSEAAAATATGAMAAISEEAAAMSTTVVAEGEAASIGWAGILGPIGAAVIAGALLVTMFHHSSAASKEAADAAKAYGDALKAGNTAELTDSIVTQLTKNNVPAKVDELNKSLDNGKYSAKEFASALQSGGKPLTELRRGLQSIIDVNEKIAQQRARSQGRGVAADPIAQDAAARSKAARTLLNDLNAQNAALTRSQIKEIATYKSLGMVAVAVDQVSSKLGIGSDEVKTYAAMLGLAVTKSGDLVDATRANQQAILAVSKAYDAASQSGDLMLAADAAFSKSAGAAADRATLIGATLKASNGDALMFAASMAGTTSAVDSLTSAFKSQSDQLAQQSRDQKDAADAVTVAQKRVNEIRGKAKHSAAELASAEKELSDAQYNAGKAGALAYADTERAAIKFTGAGKTLKATIDTTAKGAGDLVSQLQAIQDAAVKAAGAIYQHEGATKRAADDAYAVYVSKTKKALIDNRKELGLTLPQATALAKAYFDTPKSVKTLIESEGHDKVLDVLNRIGQLLAHITGQTWDPKVDLKKQAADAKIKKLQQDINNIKQGKVPGLSVYSKAAHDMIQRLQREIDALHGKLVLIDVGVLGTVIRSTVGTHNAPVDNNNTIIGPGHAGGGDITGSGPRGVDSVLTPSAPGEWMATTRGADLLRRIFGRGGMAQINRGLTPAVPMPTGAAAGASGTVPSLHTGNIAEALHGMRIVIDAGSVGTLTGFVDSRVDGTMGRTARTPAARQSRAEAFGRA